MKNWNIARSLAGWLIVPAVLVASVSCARAPGGGALADGSPTRSGAVAKPDAAPMKPATTAAKPAAGAPETAAIPKLEKPKDEWRKLLSPEAYNILFEQGTEPAFSSPLYEEHRKGTFICAACFLPLFTSETKYNSGTGWPSFYAPIKGHIATNDDFKLMVPRTEYHCIRCGGHQGHVFDDGPQPTGQRWCNDGLSLLFVPDGQPLPDLRK